jgi:hypothetical protein
MNADRTLEPWWTCPRRRVCATLESMRVVRGAVEERGRHADPNSDSDSDQGADHQGVAAQHPE